MVSRIFHGMYVWWLRARAVLQAPRLYLRLDTEVGVNNLTRGTRLNGPVTNDDHGRDGRFLTKIFA